MSARSRCRIPENGAARSAGLRARDGCACVGFVAIVRRHAIAAAKPTPQVGFAATITVGVAIAAKPTRAAGLPAPLPNRG